MSLYRDTNISCEHSISVSVAFVTGVVDDVVATMPENNAT